MFKDISGQSFGNWRVVRRVPSPPGKALWLCRCVCGSERLISTAFVRRGEPKSCGCKRGKHRHSRPGHMNPTYSSWRNMIARCNQPSNPAFAHYQKSGITVCARWQHPADGYVNFLADMGERPSRLHTLDRWPDNFGNYEPGNCRWATKSEQANNRRTNTLIEYGGRTFTLSELAYETGRSKSLLRSRLIRNKHPWTVEEAVSRPPMPSVDSRTRR